MRLRRTSRFLLPCPLILLTLCATSRGTWAASVLDAGFCLKRSGRTCERRVQQEATLSMKDLPSDEQGRKVLSFYSLLSVEAGEVFLHAWERDGETYKTAQKPRLSISARMAERVQRLAPDLERSFRGISVKLGKNLLVIPIASRVKSKSFVIFSHRLVAGPGTFVARVLDASGQPLPGSKPMEVKVVP